MRSHRVVTCLLAAGLTSGMLAACTSGVQVTGPAAIPQAQSAASFTGIH